MCWKLNVYINVISVYRTLCSDRIKLKSNAYLQKFINEI